MTKGRSFCHLDLIRQLDKRKQPGFQKPGFTYFIMAGETGIEPAAPGFGDQCSAN